MKFIQFDSGTIVSLENIKTIYPKGNNKFGNDTIYIEYTIGELQRISVSQHKHKSFLDKIAPISRPHLVLEMTARIQILVLR